MGNSRIRSKLHYLNIEPIASGAELLSRGTSISDVGLIVANQMKIIPNLLNRFVLKYLLSRKRE
ncbi:MAG: hypothetical protein GX267_08285 [Fibrobacter sp.]|nr:hypothetical protein [Fibrobacter sp.]